MKTTTFNKNLYHTTHAATKNTGKKSSFTEKIRAYWNENSKEIIMGMMSFNGSADIYQVYKMLNA